jgi:hypothetical protein
MKNLWERAKGSMKLIIRLQARYRGSLARKKAVQLRLQRDTLQTRMKGLGTGVIVPQSSQELAQNSGEQTIEYPDGSVYKGGLVNGVREGLGTLTFPEGAKYTGEWKQNEANGKGTFTDKNGNKYEGEWARMQANGHGKYTKADGSTHEGKWRDDLQHGLGEEHFANGCVYVGEYADGNKQGQGRYLWADGSRYEGSFRANAIEGQVRLSCHLRRAPIHGLMADSMQAAGKRIVCMVEGFIHGPRDSSMKDSFLWTRSMGWADSCCLMGKSTMESGKTASRMGWAG